MKTMKLLILILIVTFSSCKKENFFDTDGANYENNSEPRGIMELGNQLQNPYSVESMTRAYDHLKDSLGSSFPSMYIELTHYYVK